MKKIFDTETIIGLRRIHKGHPVVVHPAGTADQWQGIILVAGQKFSMVRYDERGTLRERRILNTLLCPVVLTPKVGPAPPIAPEAGQLGE